MGRKKEKKEKIILTKENLLYQPLPLAVSGYEATSLQQNVTIAILRKLKTSIKEIRDNQFKENPRQLSIFTTSGVKENFLQNGDLVFDIHMSELGCEAKHYQVAFNMLYSISDAIIYIPIDEGGKSKMLRTKLFDTIDENVEKVIDKKSGNVVYKYRNRNPVSTVVIRKPVAEFLFPAEDRIYDFLDNTAMMISERFPKRIYLYLSSYKYLSTYKVDYWKFRHDIGFNDKDAPIDSETNERMIKYPFYCDFVKRVLAPATSILKEMSNEYESDFYFDVEPIYKGSKRAKNPDELLFTFHISDLGKAIQCEKGQVSKDIEREMYLKKELNQSKTQVSALMKRVTDEHSAAFWKKVSQLVGDLRKKRKTPIEDVRKWANASLTRYLDELEETALEKKPIDLFSGVGDVIEVPKKVKEKVPVLSDEEKKTWDKFLDCVRERVNEPSYKTWFEPIVFLSFKENMVYLQVPSKFFYEFLEDKYIEVMKEALHLSFGDEAKLYYHLKQA